MAKESADGQEKSEAPTAKKKSKARTEGQVARSKELNGFLVLITGGLCFLFLGPILLQFVSGVAENYFQVDRALLKDPLAIVSQLKATVYDLVRTLLLFLSLIVLVSISSPMFIGGFNFSTKAFMPKLSKLNPWSGLKRMFSKSSLVELLKAVGKFMLIAPVAVMLVAWQAPKLMILPRMAIEGAMASAIDILIWTFLLLSASIIIIVLIDVPFQMWNHNEQLKMTKQEVKDENKNTEGNPEVKGRIRRLQQERAMQRMMGQVAEADVVITNPTHYAVALRYDQSSDEAPILLAKGKNLVALKIREIAQENDIMIMESPPLARSIFHTTEVDQEIPTGLYMAVAKVLAYVHQLRAFRAGRTDRPVQPSDLHVPPELQFD